MCEMKIDIEFTSHQMDIIPATLANETDVYTHNRNQLKWNQSLDLLDQSLLLLVDLSHSTWVKFYHW